MENVGKRLKEIRLGLGRTQDEVSAGTGFNPSQISYYERGNGDPTLSTLRKFADYYGVSLSDLFTKEPPPPPPTLPPPRVREPTPEEIFLFMLGKVKATDSQQHLIRIALQGDEEFCKRLLTFAKEQRGTA